MARSELIERSKVVAYLLHLADHSGNSGMGHRLASKFPGLLDERAAMLLSVGLKAAADQIENGLFDLFPDPAAKTKSN